MIDNARTRRAARYLHRRHTDQRAADCPLCAADVAAAAAGVDDQLRRMPRRGRDRRTR